MFFYFSFKCFFCGSLDLLKREVYMKLFNVLFYSCYPVPFYCLVTLGSEDSAQKTVILVIENIMKEVDSPGLQDESDRNVA